MTRVVKRFLKALYSGKNHAQQGMDFSLLWSMPMAILLAAQISNTFGLKANQDSGISQISNFRDSLSAGSSGSLLFPGDQLFYLLYQFLILGIAVRPVMVRFKRDLALSNRLPQKTHGQLSIVSNVERSNTSCEIGNDGDILGKVARENIGLWRLWTSTR